MNKDMYAAEEAMIKNILTSDNSESGAKIGYESFTRLSDYVKNTDKIYNPRAFYEFYLEFTKKMLNSNFNGKDIYSSMIKFIRIIEDDNKLASLRFNPWVGFWNGAYNGSSLLPKVCFDANAYTQMCELVLDKIVASKSFNRREFMAFLNEFISLWKNVDNKWIFPGFKSITIMKFYNKYKNYISVNELKDAKELALSQENIWGEVKNPYIIKGVWNREDWQRSYTLLISYPLYFYAKSKIENGFELTKTEINELENKIIKNCSVDVAYLFARDIEGANIDKLMKFITEYDIVLARKLVTDGFSFTFYENIKDKVVNNGVCDNDIDFDLDKFPIMLEKLSAVELKVLSLKLKYKNYMSSVSISNILGISVEDVENALENIENLYYDNPRYCYPDREVKKSRRPKNA